MRSRISLSSRLTRWYIGTFLIFLGGGFIATWLLVNGILDQRIDDELVEDAAELVDVYRESGISGLRSEIADELSGAAAGTEFYRVLNRNETVVIEAGLSQFDRTELSGRLLPADDFRDDDHILLARRYTVNDGEEEKEVTYREIVVPLDTDRFLHLAESTEQKDTVMNALGLAFASMVLLVFPIAGYLGWRVVRRAIKGVEEVSDIAKRIQRGHMSERVEIVSSDLEIDQLARAFNTMLDCIRDLVVEMREMTDNIAHDLKGPIARIRFMSELSLSRNLSKSDQQDSASKTIDECDRLLKMIDLSLDVAEAEAGMAPSIREKFDLSQQVADACELFAPVAEERQITLKHEIQPGCIFFGNQGAVQRMIANVLDNALKYSDQGDCVDVSLKISDSGAVIEVSDSGIGISETDQSLVFNRFFRCDRSRSREGCGLGLSFSRAVARQYGGEISVTSQTGKGSQFRLYLPLEHAKTADITPENDKQSEQQRDPPGQRTIRYAMENAERDKDSDSTSAAERITA